MSSSSPVLRGLDMILYTNTGTYSTPVWGAVDNVIDLTRGLTKAEGEASSRASEYALSRGTLKQGEFTWKMLNIPTDTDLLAIQAAYDGDLVIEFAFATGAITTNGTIYRRFECEIFDISDDEPLNNVSTVSVKAKPTYTGNTQGTVTTVSGS